PVKVVECRFNYNSPPGFDSILVPFSRINSEAFPV
ncbi:unnamed protein product, partial [Brassica rapa]